MRAFCDGSGNSPRGSSSACVILDYDGRVIAEHSKFLGYGVSNNIAEYEGVIDCLTKAAELGIKEIDIFSDSQLIVYQVEEKWQVKDQKLMVLRERVWNLALEFDEVSISWIPREKNKRADELCRIELDANSDDPKTRKKARLKRRLTRKVTA